MNPTMTDHELADLKNFRHNFLFMNRFFFLLQTLPIINTKKIFSVPFGSLARTYFSLSHFYLYITLQMQYQSDISTEIKIKIERKDINTKC